MDRILVVNRSCEGSTEEGLWILAGMMAKRIAAEESAGILRQDEEEEVTMSSYASARHKGEISFCCHSRLIG
jgi:hypothetical protein